jgi:hypothetical protein
MHTARWGLCRWWWSEAAERGTSGAVATSRQRGLLSHMYRRHPQGRILGPMREGRRAHRGAWIVRHVMRGLVFVE